MSEETIRQYASILCDGTQPLKRRFRALFALKNLGGPDSVHAIGACFNDPSALLKHELAYCLGQMRHTAALPVLINVLADTSQEPMVRHEAGEALGAIGDPSCLDVLRKFAQDPAPEVSETCQLAIKRILWLQEYGASRANDYSTVDPAPATSDIDDVIKLQNILTDEQQPLWDRYRAMFRLRDINTKESVLALAQGLNCEGSALFRHEVAFVLGQMQSEHSVEQLIARLAMPDENGMVRHECAEALGAVGNARCKEALHQFLLDRETVVRESCEVALDIVDYNEDDKQLQYAACDV